MIEAFSQIANKHPDWKVLFFGNISEKDYAQKCAQIIKEKHLEKQILFMGNTSQVYQELQKAAICAFPSRAEGFSIAQTEALNSGLPCVGFRKSPGVNELIKHTQNGFLANDTNDFALYLDRLINDENLRHNLGRESKKITEEYSLSKIASKWEQVIDEVIQNYHPK